MLCPVVFGNRGGSNMAEATKPQVLEVLEGMVIENLHKDKLDKIPSFSYPNS